MYWHLLDSLTRRARFYKSLIFVVRLHPFQLISSKSLNETRFHFHYQFLHGNLATKVRKLHGSQQHNATPHRPIYHAHTQIRATQRIKDTQHTHQQNCKKWMRPKWTLRFTCWNSAHTINWHTEIFTRFLRHSVRSKHSCWAHFTKKK